MEVFAILSSCVALIAITLIFNLFVNLRNTDKAVQNEVKQWIFSVRGGGALCP